MQYTNKFVVKLKKKSVQENVGTQKPTQWKVVCMNFFANSYAHVGIINYLLSLLYFLKHFIMAMSIVANILDN
jgi:hypothetical protein